MYVSSLAKPVPNHSGDQLTELLNAGMTQNIYAVALDPADVDAVLSTPQMYIAIDPKRPEAAKRVLERQEEIREHGLWVASDSFESNMQQLHGYEGNLALEWLPPQDPTSHQERSYDPNHILCVGRQRFPDADVRLLIDVSHGISTAIHHPGTGHHINKYPVHDPAKFPALPQFPLWGSEHHVEAYPVTFPRGTSEWWFDTLDSLDPESTVPFAHIGEHVYALNSLDKSEAKIDLKHVSAQHQKVAYFAPFTIRSGSIVRRSQLRYATRFSSHLPISGVPGQNVHYPGDLFADGNVDLTKTLTALQHLGIETLIIETDLQFKKTPLLRADSDFLSTHLRQIPSGPKERHPHRRIFRIH